MLELICNIIILAINNMKQHNICKNKYVISQLYCEVTQCKLKLIYVLSQYKKNNLKKNTIFVKINMQSREVTNKYFMQHNICEI